MGLKSTLEEMLIRYKNIKLFNQLMLDKKYTNKDLAITKSRENLLLELYNIDSFNTLKSLLIKTNFRLLVGIEKGCDNLVDIVNKPNEWVINRIQNDTKAWIDKNVLIFKTETSTGVFSHVSRGEYGEYKYIDNKWQ